MQPRLTEGPVGPTLFRLSIPMVWGLLAIIIVMAAEAFYIAKLGAAPLAAISFAFPVLMLMENLALGIGIGASSVVARAIGSGVGERVQRYVLGSLLLALVAVGSVGLLIWLALEPLFRLLGTTPDLMPMVRDYMVVAIPASVMIALPIVGNSCLRGAGETQFAGYNMVVISVLSMALMPIFIFGYGPFPRLGLVGAAWAALITETVSFLISLYALIFREKLLGWCRLTLCEVWREWREILRVGMPATVNNMIPGVIAGLTTALLAAEGGQMAVAGYGVAGRIENFALLVFWALSSVIGPMAGQNLGAGRLDRVAETRRIAFRFCLWFGGAAAIVFAVLAQPLAAVFSEAPAIARVTVQYLWIVPISYGLWGVVMMANGLFNGTGRPHPALGLTLLRLIALYMPLVFLGREIAGVAGIFAAATLANLVAGGVAWWWSGRPAQGSATKTLTATSALPSSSQPLAAYTAPQEPVP